MLPHQERVVAESNDLREKLSKLAIFIDGDLFKKLDVMDQDLLRSQSRHMADYLDVLRRRIARFT